MISCMRAGVKDVNLVESGDSEQNRNIDVKA